MSATLSPSEIGFKKLFIQTRRLNEAAGLEGKTWEGSLAPELRRLTPEQIVQIAPNFSRATSLTLIGSWIDAEAAKAIEGMPMLRTLTIRRCGVWNKAAQHLIANPSLEIIEVTGVGISRRAGEVLLGSGKVIIQRGEPEVGVSPTCRQAETSDSIIHVKRWRGGRGRDDGQAGVSDNVIHVKPWRGRV